MKKLPNRVHQSVCARWLLDKRYVIRARGFWIHTNGMPRNLSSENNGSSLPSKAQVENCRGEVRAAGER